MTFQVLALSGGGFLGLYSVTVLAEIEKLQGRSVASSFDLLAGTSVGGIVALGLAADTPANAIQAAFERHGQQIFSNRPPPTTPFGAFRDILRGACSSKYEAEVLKETIVEIVGPDTRVGELRHPVLIPAINLSKGKPQIFKTSHHPDFRLDLNLRVVDVALATSGPRLTSRLRKSVTRYLRMEGYTLTRLTFSRSMRQHIFSRQMREVFAYSALVLPLHSFRSDTPKREALGSRTGFAASA